MKLTDEDLVRNAHSEFERVGSQFFGWHTWDCQINTPGGATVTRVVVAGPEGRTALKDAPTQAEALGLAIAELLRKRG